jgi:hypothetical protein
LKYWSGSRCLDSDATMAEVYFGRDVPNVVRRNEMLESVIRVREVIIHNRPDEADFNPAFPPIDASNFELVIRSMMVQARQAFSDQCESFL